MLSANERISPAADEENPAKIKEEEQDMPDYDFFQDPIQTHANLRDSWPHSWSVYVVGILATLSPHSLLLYSMYTLEYKGLAFSIATLVYYAIIGLPMVYLEMQLGQYSGGTSIEVFNNMVPLFSGLGWLMALIALLKSIPSLKTLALLVTKTYACLFKTCKMPYWGAWALQTIKNTSEQTADYNSSGLIPGYNSSEQINKSSPVNVTNTTLVDTLLTRQVELYSGQMAALITLLFVAIAVTLSFKLKYVAYVYYFLSPVALISFLLPFFRYLALPGAMHGIKHFVYFDINMLLQAQIWADACVISTACLTISMGVYHTIGSMNRFNFKIAKPVCAIVLGNMWASFMSTLFTMAVAGSYYHYLKVLLKGKPKWFIQRFYGTTTFKDKFFITFSSIEPTYAWSFMIMVCILAYSTTLMYVYPLVQLVATSLPWKSFLLRPIASTIICTGILVVPLVFVHRNYWSYLLVFDGAADDLILWAILVEVLVVFWAYGKSSFREKNAHSQSVESMAGWVFYFYLQFVLPFITVLMIGFAMYHFHRPLDLNPVKKVAKAELMGIGFIILLMVPAVGNLIQNRSALKESVKPKDPWSPLPESHVTVALLKTMDKKQKD